MSDRTVDRLDHVDWLVVGQIDLDRHVGTYIDT